MNHRLLLLPAFFLLLFFLIEPVAAQCPMCRASVESSMKEGSTYALGLNRGILYLLSMPYILFSAIFLLWYRNYRKHQAAAS